MAMTEFKSASTNQNLGGFQRERESPESLRVKMPATGMNCWETALAKNLFE